MFAEILLSVSKKEAVVYDCSACSGHGPLPTSHKFVSFIVKHPPSDAIKATVRVTGAVRLMDGGAAAESSDKPKAGIIKTKSKTKEKPPKDAANVKEEEDESEWTVDTSAEAVQKRLAEELASMTIKGYIRT